MLASALQESAAGSGLILAIGADWPSGATFPTHPWAALTPDQAHTCAPVSTLRTVTIHGTPMTPTQAYALQQRLPDSAP